jgi:hypothetical protein
MRSNSMLKVVAVLCIACLTMARAHADQQPRARFLIDDPMMADDDAAVDAGGVRVDPLGAYADFVLNTFLSPGDKRPIPAVNVNTLGEVPDSSWFTNRIGARRVTIDEIVRGPNQLDRLDITDWVIVQGKNTGRQAGFRAVSASDPTGRVYQIEFDPREHPEMATGAEMIGTLIYHALGYNVVEMYLADLDPATLTIAPTATIEIAGRTRRFTRRDLESILRRSAMKTDGRYRVTVSPFAEGKYVGPFRYYGTRPDDPNDIYPHEHRRELRANRVFAAWLNHDDSRAVNSLDMLVGPKGQQYVKHYMFDFGSILGSGTNDPDHPWVGHEYVVESKPALLTLASFGLWRRPFINMSTPLSMGAAGGFTSERFVPANWKPHYPNPAFANMQPDDAFWAARRVAAFSSEALAAVVDKAEFSDPRVRNYVLDTLLDRRALVLHTWLAAHNPIVDVRIERGTLRFTNAAERAGLVEPGSKYTVSWFRFDNRTGHRQDVAWPEQTTDTSATLPTGALQDADYIGVEIRTLHSNHANWEVPVRAYFRATSRGWSAVGLERGQQQPPRAERAER